MSIRNSLFFSVMLGWFPGLAVSAQPTLTFDGLPPAISPGASFDVTVRLIGAADLAAYNLEFTLAGPGVAGIDYFFSSAAKPTVHYVFTPDDGNFLSVLLTPTEKNRAIVSDFLNAGDMDTVSGVNDELTRLTITTSTSFAGPLVLGLATDSLELFDANLDPIAGAAAIAIAPPSARMTVVPEPQTALGLGGMLLLLRRKRRAQEAE